MDQFNSIIVFFKLQIFWIEEYEGGYELLFGGKNLFLSGRFQGCFIEREGGLCYL